MKLKLNLVLLLAAVYLTSCGVETTSKESQLKNRTLNLNKIFLQKESRIEAMMTVMTFILLVNNLAQKRVRDFLVEKNKGFPNQVGRSTRKPTFMWMAYVMRHISLIQTQIGDRIYREIVGLTSSIKLIVSAIGDEAKAIYGFP